MRNIVQEYKVLSLIAPVIQTTTTTGTGVDVEIYTDDAMAVVNFGAVSGGTPSIVVTIMGSLVATPTTYDQTLATFVAATAAGIAAGRANLSSIKNVRAVATQTGAGNVAVGITLVANSAQDGATLNSLTAA